MKRSLSNLNNARKARVDYSLKSTILASIVLLAFTVLSINCTTSQTADYIVPESNVNSVPIQTQGKLPETAIVELQKLNFLKGAFRRNINISNQGGLDDFHIKTRPYAKYSAIVSNCTFDVLKAFVAQGWAPIVKYEFHGRNWEILPISDYNDHTQLISLQDPNHISKRRVKYTDFKSSWRNSSRNRCVLITPVQITERDVRRVLGKYLPKEEFKQISVTSR